MNTHEIIICGFGGQGIIFAGELLGRAGVKAGMEAAQSASYGSEARGSACHAGIVLSSEPISYPKVKKPVVLVAMSQTAYDKFAPNVALNGKIFFDCNLVNNKYIKDVEQVGFPATNSATEIGRRGVANVVMLSAVIKSTGIITKQSLEEALREQSPASFLEINLQALEAGFQLAVKRQL